VCITAVVPGEAGGPILIVPRTFGIARGRSSGRIGQDMEAIGAIVLPIIVRPAIGRQTTGLPRIARRTAGRATDGPE